MTDVYYLGHSCLKLKNKNISLIIDPFSAEIGFKMPKEIANVVCVTHAHAGHNFVQGVVGDYLRVEGPGEYEVTGVTILGLNSYHDDKKGKERGKNTIYKITIDDITFVHLGDLGGIPQKELIDELEDVNVLMVPVGGVATINARQAMELISKLEPQIVIPIHYRTPRHNQRFQNLEGVEVFAKVSGLSPQKISGRLSLIKEKLPETTTVYIFE